MLNYAELKRTLILGIFLIPLQEQGQWQVLKYRHIPPNKVTFDAKGMEIKVDHSASPIIYPLPKVQLVNAISIEGSVTGQLNLPQGENQGSKGNDDYQVRIGLVLRGEKKLNFVQRMMAPDWIIKLFSLAPQDWGVDRIFFMNGTHKASEIGHHRRHPASELLEEWVLWLLPESGKFLFRHQLADSIKGPREVLAIWLASDGDDTGSKYQIQFTKIELELADKTGQN